MVLYIAVQVDILPPKAMVVIFVLHNDLPPSQSMSCMSFLEVAHMHSSLYLRAPHIDKMNNIGLLDHHHILHVATFFMSVPIDLKYVTSWYTITT